MPREKVPARELESILADWIAAEEEACAGVRPMVHSREPDEGEGNWSVDRVRYGPDHDETHCSAIVERVVARARERYELE